MSAMVEDLMTVFIVDDDPSICDSLCNLLASEGIAAQAFGSTEEFFYGWKQEMPGCLLLDVRLPGVTGVEFQEHLRAADVRIPIIIMTAHGDIPMVRRVMKAGAVEFLTKPFQREELLEAVQEAFARDKLQRSRSTRLEAVWKCYRRLSAREREVMALVTSGKLNKQAAAELGLSEITVKLHRRKVMEKMEAASLADLVRAAEILREPHFNKV